MLGALALLAATQAVAPAEPVTGVAVMCDPVRYHFSLRAEVTAAALDHRYPIARFVPYDDLFFADGLPGWINEVDVQAPLVRYERCGPYTFKLEGDAYNMNVQGESGAYDHFAAVRVLRANGVIFPADGSSLRLTVCDRTLPRARPCPDEFAIRLDGSYDPTARRLRLTVTTRSDQDGADPRTQVRQVTVEDDLTLWKP